MIDERTTPASGDWPRSLVRRVDGAELPASGTWTVADSHATVVFTSPRRFRRAAGWRGRSTGATIVVGESPDDISVTLRVDHPGLEATSGSPEQPVVRPHFETTAFPSHYQWALSGALSVDGRIVPIRATLSYRGVWRRGDGAYGWFELVGVIDDGAPAWRQVQFSFELLADGPAAVSSERGAA
jgi:hypothetical protein